MGESFSEEHKATFNNALQLQGETDDQVVDQSLLVDLGNGHGVEVPLDGQVVLHDHALPSNSDIDLSNRIQWVKENDEGNLVPDSNRFLKYYDKQILDHRIEAQQASLEAVPQNTEGLNMDSIYDFLSRYGLVAPPITVMDMEHRDEFKEKALLPEDLSDGIKGAHVPQSGVNFVLRDTLLEKLNGPRITETFIVHELAHAARKSGQLVANKTDDAIKYRVPRTGFAVDKNSLGSSETVSRAQFFEEGFAQHIAQEYLEEQQGANQGLIEGYEERVCAIIALNGPSGNFEISVPLKYAYVSGEGDNAAEVNVDVAASSEAAYGLDLLLNKDPELVDVMMKVREDPIHIREFVQRINQLSPGLYGELRLLGYDKYDFAKGVRLIIDRLYEGDDELAAEQVLDKG